MTIDMSQFYQVFFDEAAEHLANMEGLLLGLDVHDPSLDDLNAIFRAAHSIKGGAGTFGFTDIASVTHVLENLLDKLRREELKLVTEMVDAFLAAGDVLKGQLDAHRNGGISDEAAAVEICERLETLTQGHDDAVEPNPQGPVVAANDADPGVASEMNTPKHMLAKVSEALSQPPARFSVIFRSTADDTQMERLWAGLRDLGDLEIRKRPVKRGKKADKAWEIELLSSRSEADVRELFDFLAVVEELRIAVSAPHPRGDEAASPSVAGYGFFDEAPGIPLKPTENAGYGFFDAAPGTPPALVTVEGNGVRAEVPQADGQTKPQEAYGFFEPVPPAIAANIERARAAESGTAIPPTEISHHGRDENIPGRRQTDLPSVTALKAGRREVDKAVPPSGAAGDSSSIRVGVEKVDQLINLVGELVITQSMIAQMATRVDPVIYENLMHGLDQLERNTRGLQEAVMSIRMMPIAFVFSRFPRVVRDLAAKLGKKVELKTVGEGTELDKGVIEKIADPLTHLVRNSLDHGVELPEKRVAAGKPETGTITLKAFHQSGSIVVEVQDDGGGLSREKILAKARERGISVSDSMQDQEVWQLIFEAGFSTAEVVTDVSGRGVGMDVVKRNIRGMGGTIDIDSVFGLGTRIRIRLPLTLAILDGMSVAVGSELYIVPLTVIIESLQPEASDLATVQGTGLVIKVRGDYLPVIALHETLGIEPRNTDPSKGIMIIVESEGRKVALLVDELMGQHQVVIKSLESNYRKVQGCSGATIMGDGRVALILDVAAMVRTGARLMAKAA